MDSIDIMVYYQEYTKVWICSNNHGQNPVGEICMCYKNGSIKPSMGSIKHQKIGVKFTKFGSVKKKMAPIFGQRPMEPMAFEQPFSTEMILPAAPGRGDDLLGQLFGFLHGVSPWG